MANLNIPSTRDRTLDAFKGKMVGGGARPNLFECELFFPNDAIPPIHQLMKSQIKVGF